MEIKLAIVIVLYYPDLQNLIRNVSILQPSVNRRVILVDNSSISLEDQKNAYVYYIVNHANLGIATAQNIGIYKAKELGCSHILFFDQDSHISSNYVECMLVEYARLKGIYSNLAVLGPTVINMSKNQQYKVPRVSVKYDARILPSVISSGSVMEIETLEKIGGMEDKLFIDYVDNEWGWRAKREGYICCATLKVKLQHKIGQKDCRFCGIPILISAPIRYYYQYRNFLWLLRRPYVPWGWKIKTVIRRVAEIVLVPCFSTQKVMTIKNIFRGIKDGLHK